MNIFIHTMPASFAAIGQRSPAVGSFSPASSNICQRCPKEAAVIIAIHCHGSQAQRGLPPRVDAVFCVESGKNVRRGFPTRDVCRRDRQSDEMCTRCVRSVFAARHLHLICTSAFTMSNAQFSWPIAATRCVDRSDTLARN